MSKAHTATEEIGAYFKAREKGSLRVEAKQIEKEFPKMGRLDKTEARERVMRWASSNGFEAEKKELYPPCYIITKA